MSAELHRYPTLQAASVAAADACVQICEEAIARRGRASIALSGGETPQVLHAELATRPSRWSLIDVFFSDERGVAPDDPASNYGKAKAALLDHIEGAKVYRMRGEASDLDAAAAEYAREIEAHVPACAFDLVFLGLGDNGHTASLFPDTAAEHETEAWVVATEVPAAVRRRLTFTFPLINAAHNVIFIVAGAEKADVLARVLAGKDDLPAERVRAKRVAYFVDASAAARLGVSS